MNLFLTSYTICFFNLRALVSISMFLLMMSLAPGVLAQQLPPSPDEVTEMFKQLRKQIAELEAQNKALDARTKVLETHTQDLEARLSKSPAQTPAPTPTQVAAATEPAQTEGEAAKGEREAGPAMDHSGHSSRLLGTPLMQIRGFSDVSYRATKVKGETNTFALGQLALFVNSRLSDKMNVLAEIAFEMEEDNGVEIDLERILLQYTVNDYFNLNVGRYHTAIGYYNTAFHHGTWFQTATGRPHMFAFEDDGGILPIHNVGVSVNGRIPSGDLRLSYVAELGNGRASHSKEAELVQVRRDENNGKALNLALHSRPRWVPGLQLGFNIYRDRLTPDGLSKIGQTIWAAHAVYQTPSFEFLNEGVLIRHTLLDTKQTINTPAFYTQISRRFYNKVRPYFRYEYMNVPERDPVNEVGRRNGPALGVRYDLGEFAAFKMQYNRTAYRTKSTSNDLQLQFAFTF